MRDNDKILQPKVLVLPDVTDNSYTANATDGYISGQIAISGQSLVVWMGEWCFISGSTTSGLLN